MKLWLKVLLGLFLGVVVGLIFKHDAVRLEIIGTIFLSLIQMLIVPLVFSSMVSGICSIHDPKKLGRVGIKTIFTYIITTIIAVSIGLLFAKLIQPGMGAGLSYKKSAVPVISGVDPMKMIIDLFPTNPMRAFAEGNILQIIVFAIFIGLAIIYSGERGRPLLNFIESVAEVMYRLTAMIMELAPYGIFAIMATAAGNFGPGILISLSKFLFTNYLASSFHLVVVYCGILIFLARLNPWHFFRGMRDAIMFAFSTNSSSASLPVTLHCAQHNLGVSRNICNFVIPIGSTINMNGAAISQGIAAVFVAQAFGITLTFKSLMVIVITATVSAIGAAGIPGSSLIMLSIVFGSVGLPLEGIALIAGVDRLREMVSTVVNVLGDAVVAVYVGKTEGELDENQYNRARLIEYEGSDV